MAAAGYDECEANVLQLEGGYTNNPRDPGGPTNWGITIYDARLYWKHDATAADVKTMPKTVAQDIYRKKYWNVLACDSLPAGLDYSVFDYGVNSGIARSGKILRGLVGLPETDWHVTSAVLDEVGKHDAKTLIAALNKERLTFLEHLSTWDEFGRGWQTRVNHVDALSLAMASRPVPVSHPAPVSPPQVPSPPPSPPPPPSAPPTPGKGVVKSEDLFAHLGELWQELFHFLSKPAF